MSKTKNELSQSQLKQVTGGNPITFYVGPNGRVTGPNIQVGDYFISDAYYGSGTIEIYRLERKEKDNSATGIATKFSTHKRLLPNYTIENNVSISLAGMSRIIDPDWITD